MNKESSRSTWICQSIPGHPGVVDIRQAYLIACARTRITELRGRVIPGCETELPVIAIRSVVSGRADRQWETILPEMAFPVIGACGVADTQHRGAECNKGQDFGGFQRRHTQSFSPSSYKRAIFPLGYLA